MQLKEECTLLCSGARACRKTAAVIMVGEHVKSRHGHHIGGVEFDEDSAIKYSKDLIESALNTKVQQVSTKACFAESAIKLIKQRVRIKLSSCEFSYIICHFHRLRQRDLRVALSKEPLHYSIRA